MVMDEQMVGLAATFIPIKPGGFQMGSPEDQAMRDKDEALHSVTLTRAFELQATPVTQLQYFLVMGKNPAQFKEKEDTAPEDFKVMLGQGLNVNYPVESVSWDDAQQFIRRLNRMQKEYTYRLPTEAEWEYAARAGTPSAFLYSFGSDQSKELDSHAWHDGNSGNRTHNVGSRMANPWGLFDMHGNVWQWVQDFYGDYPTGAVIDPTGPKTGSIHVIRGGSWISSPRYVRTAQRYYGLPGHRDSHLGFRLVRSKR
jgi:formylglycine-generating enzyme required for sulfatase activity